jgi:hypothetical protein
MTTGPRTVAHKLIMKTAVDMAQAVFEEAMSKDNELYRGMKAAHPGKSERYLRRVFVSNMAPRLLGDARATLAQMLTLDIDEALKRDIYEALTLDNAVPVDRDLRPRLTTYH